MFLLSQLLHFTLVKLHPRDKGKWLLKAAHLPLFKEGVCDCFLGQLSERGWGEVV
jgi:hypothetical protein